MQAMILDYDKEQNQIEIWAALDYIQDLG